MNNLFIDNLTVGYKNGSVVDSITQEFNCGEAIGLIGKNGCGKTTFLKTVANLNSKLSGDIFYNKNSLHSLEVSKYVSIGLTGFYSMGYFKAEDIVALGRSVWTGMFGKLRAEDFAIIDNSMKICECYNLKSRRFDILSDGQKQKVLNARVLAQKTAILLFDEPTSFLDYGSKITFFKNIVEYTKENSLITIISTHDILYAKKYLKKFFLIDNKEFKPYNKDIME